ncbi:MAG: beta-propeller fold lactonase family protein [Mycobacteriales bacterium]
MSANRKLAFLATMALTVVAPAGLAGSAAADADPRAVYTSTNAAAGNQVVVYDRHADGTLAETARVATGGTGTGGGLGSQGAVTLTDDGHRLLVVNAGSDEVSLFNVTHVGLSFVGKAASGGDRPISVTVRGPLAYVVNAGGAANVSGFSVSDDAITPLSGSTEALNVAGPAQVQFTPDGNALVVTGKATNSIDVFNLDASGRPQAPVTSPSAGPTPFGFDFDKEGNLLVSEAAGGAPGASSSSSYTVQTSGALSAISGPIPNGQGAACWLVTGNSGKFAYVTNTASGTISTYRIGSSGSLSVVSAAAATSGGNPTDEAVSRNGRYLYVINNNLQAITAYRTAADGSLTAIPGAALSTQSVGVAAS